MRSVIFDLDGTLANVNHRRHHIMKPAVSIPCCSNIDCLDCGGFGSYMKGQAPDWDSWNAEMHLDPPNDSVVEMFAYHKEIGDQIIICTGRFKEFEAVTQIWLRGLQLESNLMFMRPDGVFDSDHIVKRKMLDHIRGLGCNPHLAYDDRDSVVKMWRGAGLTCFQVAEGAF